MFYERCYRTFILLAFSCGRAKNIIEYVDANFFSNGGKNLGFQKNPDTFGRGLQEVTLHETIHYDEFWRNTALQHCCDIVLNCSNIATLCSAKNRRCESSSVTSP